MPTVDMVSSSLITTELVEISISVGGVFLKGDFPQTLEIEFSSVSKSAMVALKQLIY